MRRLIALVTGALLLPTALAQTIYKASSPIGLRKTIDDKTGQPRGIVRVYEADSRYFARIERSLIPGEEGRKCAACTDERKDQPFIGRQPARSGPSCAGGCSSRAYLGPRRCSAITTL